MSSLFFWYLKLIRFLGRVDNMSKVITILLLILAGLYWAQTQKLKAMAIDRARKRCKESGVQFLDHTVVHSGKKLVKDQSGRWRLQRVYLFEFTSSGENRYQGKVIFLGSHPASTELEAFPIN